MAIRIVNLRNYVHNSNEVLFKVDRTSPVGNPFYMHNEADRDTVCEKYNDYFKTKFGVDREFTDYIKQIIITSQVHDIALGCWCYPKRCHAETIKAFIERI